MNNTDMNKTMKDVLALSGSNANVRLMNRFPGNRLVGGKYSPGTHTVTLYIEEIRKQCRLLFASEDVFPIYFWIVLAHELGHAEDSELNTLSERYDICGSDVERKRIALKIEENAWDFARTIVPEDYRGILEEIIDQSLRAYREDLEPVGA
ncbi:hypothetical protein [Heyndrickxia acidicola]|uniref:Uncharacterized protein n=1 Tax=Heyndrickxia acidicola TaxID=209389 RepID=A0ABU6MJ84_9BACI|nr:hypothetical protein [Heyndrickxia acidicola]MED1204066.1 hypothetical protein [Heyndrickxia acidicola]